MESLHILLYLLAWSVLSLLCWIYFLESKNDYHNRPYGTLRIFLLLTLTLPATIFLVTIVLMHEAADRIKEKRLLRKKIEQSKYGVFERKVIVEKYCKHIWREEKSNTYWINKPFRCTKCKRRTQLTVGEFRFLRGTGMVEGEYEREPYIGRIDFYRQ